MIYPRLLNPAIQQLLQSTHPPAIILYGPRRVGKTTLLNSLISTTSIPHQVYNCDDPATANLFTNISLSELTHLLKPYQLIVFDEAQRIPNIGNTLKLITDYLPEKKVIATGSSSLNLANIITEPLTGRKQSLFLYPLSIQEIYPQLNFTEIQPLVEMYLRFGLYPKVQEFTAEIDKINYLTELTSDYLYKDALHFLGEKNLEPIKKLLIALALQIGQEVSYTELATTVGLDHKTIIKYIQVLEDSFIITKLSSFSRNLRTELNKTRKIYFLDLGIRNALIQNFNPFALRQDKGQVWENWLVIERMKHNHYRNQPANYYFWRTHDQKEIDFIEEYGGNLYTYEFKSSPQNVTKHQHYFASIYPTSTHQVVSDRNWLNFIT